MSAKQQKSVFRAYLCWLFGGIFGLHLFYLERDAQAFITWCSFGGYGIGWLADVFKIPRYVRDYNEDQSFMTELIAKMRANRKPPFSSSRFIAAVMVAYLWAQIYHMAIPQEHIFGINWTPLHWLIPAAAALGVWVVGNTGREKGSPWITIIVSYAAFTSRWYFFDDNVWLSLVVFSAALAFDTFSKRWRRKPKPKHSLVRRAITIGLCAAVYIGLWASYLYFNGTIVDSNGDEIPVHEALHHFFTSPWWTDLTQTLYDLYQFGKHHGWYEIWKQMIDTMDPQGEINSYKVLDISPTASQEEITLKWRALSREFHPDKVKDASQRRAAQDRFMEIQQAYEILSSLKSKRRRRNKKSREDDTKNESSDPIIV